MLVTEHTTLTELVKEYGEIEEIMEAFGVKSTETNPLRREIAMNIAVERASRIKGMKLNQFIQQINQAIEKHSLS